jgi:hypothetical protein
MCDGAKVSEPFPEKYTHVSFQSSRRPVIRNESKRMENPNDSPLLSGLVKASKEPSSARAILNVEIDKQRGIKCRSTSASERGQSWCVRNLLEVLSWMLRKIAELKRPMCIEKASIICLEE